MARVPIAGWNQQQRRREILESPAVPRGAVLARTRVMRAGSSPDLDYKYDTLSADDVAVASERSPTFDVAVVASVAGFRDSCGNMPLDASIPRRTLAGCPREMAREAKLVLVHVDGVRSLEQIAGLARQSLPETIEIFLQLLALGVVETHASS